MTLHIVSPSPFSQNSLQRCLSLASANDCILLIEDATLALVNATRHFGDGSPPCAIYALEADLQARGVRLPPEFNVTIIDYDGFVNLAAQSGKTLSWF